MAGASPLPQELRPAVPAKPISCIATSSAMGTANNELLPKETGSRPLSSYFSSDLFFICF